jgi:predicted enzyme related to lactoylglutathione lyase
MRHAISWFEIPASDFERAVEFYERVLDCEIDTVEMDQGPYGVFETDSDGVGGAILAADEYSFDERGSAVSIEPGETGPTVYLSVGDELSTALARVEQVGGSVLVEPQPLDNGGEYAMITDTEGNRVGLMSRT